MSELLTAKDVELKIFKKVSFGGGYSIPDVEEFLNQVAEDLEAYALRHGEQQRRIAELEESLKRHEAMKDTIKDALILAQKSAKDKEEEARHQAEAILAKAHAQIADTDVENRRRLEEAAGTADDIVATARSAAAQVLKNAESMKEEAQRRLDNVDLEAEQRIAEANEKASDITAAARLEARRAISKAKHEIEEIRQELSDLQAERQAFLRESTALAASFVRTVEEAGGKLTEKENQREIETQSKQEASASRMTLSFSPIDDEVVLS